MLRQRKSRAARRPNRRRLRGEQLENRMLLAGDPGFPYVDANNDALFNPADGDVLLDDGELDDCFFDTLVPEGPDYVVPIVGASLRIHGDPIVCPSIDFSADGGITVNTDLTATNHGLFLTSRFDNVELDDPTLHARTRLEINAAVSILSTDDVLRASGSESVIRLNAGLNIILSGTRVTAMKEVDMDAPGISINPSAAHPAIVTATPNIFGRVELTGEMDLSDAQIDANREIVLEGVQIVAHRSKLTANSYAPGTINIRAFDEADLMGAEVNARKQIVIQSDANVVNITDAKIQAAAAGSSTVEIDSARLVQAGNATISAAKSVSVNAGVNIDADFATINAGPNILSNVSIVAGGTINVSDSTIVAQKEIQIDTGILNANRSVMSAGGNWQGTVDVQADGEIILDDSDISARRQIRIVSVPASVSAVASTIQAAATGDSSVTIVADGDINISAATLGAAKLVSLASTTDIQAALSILTATPHYLGKVDLLAVLNLDATLATINATKDIEIDVGSSLGGEDSVMNAGGHSAGTIDLDAREMLLDRAKLVARKTINLDAVDTILGSELHLLAQGAVSSQVKVNAQDLSFNSAVIRARQLIELVAVDVADLARSSIGITHLGAGDLCVTATTIIVTDAVLKAPDDLKLLGTVVGIPTDISTGFLSPVSC